jgi:linoleoyl-CoA desaturase
MELIGKKIKFKEKNLPEFNIKDILNKTINNFFTSTSRSKTGDITMWIKSYIILCLYLGSYLCLIIFQPTLWFAFLLVIIMGMGYIGVGMCIMHDAAHKAYSNKSWLNTLLSWSVFLLGNNNTNWRIQHNDHHHHNTNIYNHDEDLDAGGWLRLAENSKSKKIHRYQHIYCWGIYCFYTLGRFVGEFLRISKYKKMGLEKKFTGQSSKIEYGKLLIIKIIYIIFMIFLPLQITTYSFLEIILGVFIMHAVSGLMIAIIFQLAHVVEGAEQPEPENGYINTNWTVHEINTTANFNTSKLFSWFIGGLNYQIEHHLFQKICHVHYKKLAPVVKKTIEDYDLQYKCFPSFFAALISHFRKMRQLGKYV